MIPLANKGRSSQSNASGRFEGLAREAVDDGWSEDDGKAAQQETTLTVEQARSIISRNDSPDLDFEHSINPYRGCEHGCIYCFARPSHAYLGLSPGLDFETRLFFKPNAAELLEKELRQPGYRVKRIQLGANTDPYQPTERKLGITRSVLEVLSRFGHPVGITTKSVLVTRDIDLLAPMAERGLAMVSISLTTLDRKLARSMEPRASTPERRLDAIRQLSAAGIPTIVSVSPMIPGLTDHEMEAILERAVEAGAGSAYYSTLRLSHELKQLFREWLTAEHPGRAAHVMSLVQQLRGGRDNDPRFGLRMTGEGPLALLLARRFEIARKRLGLAAGHYRLNDRVFRPPGRSGDQLLLF